MDITTLDHDSHLAAWTTSGLSQAAYCRQHSISYHVFRQWRQRRDRQLTAPASGPSAFIQLRPGRRAAGPAADVDPAVLIILSNGLQLRVTEPANIPWVRRLIGGLQSC